MKPVSCCHHSVSAEEDGASTWGRRASPHCGVPQQSSSLTGPLTVLVTGCISVPLLVNKHQCLCCVVLCWWHCALCSTYKTGEVWDAGCKMLSFASKTHFTADKNPLTCANTWFWSSKWMCTISIQCQVNGLCSGHRCFSLRLQQHLGEHLFWCNVMRCVDVNAIISFIHTSVQAVLEHRSVSAEFEDDTVVIEGFYACQRPDCHCACATLNGD